MRAKGSGALVRSDVGSTHASPAGGSDPGDAGIAWRRLAEPQPDQYDTLIALDLLHRRGYARREVGPGPSFFARQVAIRTEPPEAVSFPPACVPARPDHPNIARACELVRLWPTVFRQFHLLIDSVSVFTYRRDTSVSRHAGRPGAIAATVDEAVTFAECLVHEMAHHKLRALGVEITSAERLIRNPPTQKFKSPIRLDRLRPMSAVVHAEYSYTYVAALDIEIARKAAYADDRAAASHALARHLPKLEFGFDVIREHAEVDESGAAFMEAWQGWLDQVFAAGGKILDARGIPRQPFVHPLDGDASVHAGARPSRPIGIRARRRGDELLLSVPGRELATLNRSAAAIWQLCDGRRTLEGIAAELGQCVGRSGAALLPDVIAGVIRLHELGLLELR